MYPFYYTVISFSRNIFYALIIFSVILSSTLSAKAETIQIAVMPFKINAKEDLAYLQEGIFDILSYSLTHPGRSQVFDRSVIDNTLKLITDPANYAQLKPIGAKLNANYILLGSITIFGDSISIGAKLMSVAEVEPVLTFFHQSRNKGDVIPQINLFATQITEKILGLEGKSSVIPVRTEPSHTADRVYLEKPIKKSADSPFIKTGQPMKASSQKIWESRDFEFYINGLSVGDVNGDNRVETVVITPHEVKVFSSENGGLSSPQKIFKKKQNYFIGIDIADINGNGIDEIFITCLDTFRNNISSLVIEYNGNNYVVISEGSPWWYRVVHVPDHGKILLGQEHISGNPFSGEIFEMTWKNSHFVSTRKIKTPGTFNLLGFTVGPIIDGDRQATIGYVENDYIQIWDPDQKLVWESSEPFGGSMNYYKSIDDMENTLYLPIKIVTRKNKTDGKIEVITVKNYNIAGGILNYRHFNRSHIESFSWDGHGGGMSNYWKTHQIDAYISDFIIADFDHDGKDELIAAVIPKQGLVILTSPESKLIAYELD